MTHDRSGNFSLLSLLPLVSMLACNDLGASDGSATVADAISDDCTDGTSSEGAGAQGGTGESGTGVATGSGAGGSQGGGAGSGTSANRWWSDASPWNTPIAADAQVVPQSDAWIDALYASSGNININQGAWTPGVFWADESAPHEDFVPSSDGWHFEDVPIPAGLQPSGDSDAHAVIIDIPRARAYDFFGLKGGPGQWSSHANVIFRLDGSGWYDGSYSAGGVTGPWGARATSAALGGGLIRPEDVAANVIPHALSCASDKYVNGPPVSPATTGDGLGGSGAMPMGSRLQLDPSLDIGALGLEPGEEMIAEALQAYGCYIVDSTFGVLVIYAQNFESSLDGVNPYPGSWAGGMSRELIKLMRIVEPPPPPEYDNRDTFGQPYK
jgi:hypothetical protein